MTQLREPYAAERKAQSRPNGSSEASSFITIMVALTQDEASLLEWLRRIQGFSALRRLRQMHSNRHQLAIVQFTEKGLQCREVGRLEG